MPSLQIGLARRLTEVPGKRSVRHKVLGRGQKFEPLFALKLYADGSYWRLSFSTDGPIELQVWSNFLQFQKDV